jgi:tRNA 2-thiocytidine biosynthesis protein TtcA
LKSEGLYRAINKALGQALHRYEMIADGDRIAVGLSGGKDSLTLMWFLNERLKRIPISYELFAVYIDPGFEGGFAHGLAEYCREKGYRLHVEHTDHGPFSHSPYNRENPCFLCSRMRRKRLFEMAQSLGCWKIALGHHKDDIIETLFLNMCYAGEIATMLPRQSLFEGKMEIIRPLAFTDEDKIARFAEAHGFPRFINPCPSAGRSKRREIKGFLQTLYQTNRKIKGNLFRALSHVKTEYLLNP